MVMPGGADDSQTVEGGRPPAQIIMRMIHGKIGDNKRVVGNLR
jgi:hypothetical protein